MILYYECMRTAVTSRPAAKLLSYLPFPTGVPLPWVSSATFSAFETSRTVDCCYCCCCYCCCCCCYSCNQDLNLVVGSE